jgi:very-short-patch-repair endonuclease
MRQESATPDQRLSRIAARQHGVVGTPQLIAVGISPQGISRRAASGRLHRVHRGVYAVGHPRLSIEGAWLAAVLACGDGAALSHRSAAALWGLLPAIRGLVHVTVPGTAGRRKRRGIRIHRSRSLGPETTTRRKNVPVTTAGRTLADLRKVVMADEWRAAARQAGVLGLDIAKNAGEESPQTRSELEDRFLALCRRHHLPPPEVNVRIGPYVVDFLWREHGLVVELDGYRYHRGRIAFEDDRARDVELRLLGLHVVRFTYRQVIDQPAWALGRLAHVLDLQLPRSPAWQAPRTDL